MTISMRSRHSDEHDNQSWRMSVLMGITRIVLRFPVATVALAIALSGVCFVYSYTHLGYKSSRLDLLNPKSDHNRLWIEYVNEFGDEDDAVIVVEGPGRDQVVPVLVELSASLGREKRLFHAILHEVDLSAIRAKGLHYLPVGELQTIDHFLTQAVAITGGEWSNLQVGKQLAGLTRMLQAAVAGAPGIDLAQTLGQMEHTADSLAASFEPNSHYQSPWPGMPAAVSTLSELGTEYLVAKEGRLGFVLLRIAVGKDELARGTESITALRELIADSAARHPDVKIGLTGLPIMENDEMRSSESSMFWGGLIAFVGVVMVVVAGFGGIRHALMANVVLLIATAWAFGYAALAVGHLNILSVTFTATLIGVGIDYGTYYVSRYMELRREGHKCDESLLKTTRIAGPAIITGALSTVVAFFATGATSFKGIAELGIIAGGGILLCAIAQLFVLPALVRIVDHSRWGQQFPKPVPVYAAIGVLMKAPRLIIALAIGLTIFGVFGLRHLWFDYNLLNLEPRGLESVELERKLLSECDQSMWYALSIADSREELLAKKDKFLQLASVERTEEIVSLLPGDHEVKQPLIAGIHNRLATLPERPPMIAVDSIDELGATLAQAQELATRTPQGASCARRLELLRDALRRLPAAECYAKISQFQQQTAGDLLSRLHALKSVSNPEPPQLTDLPASLVSRFVGQNGKYLLKIYGRGDIWNMDSLTDVCARCARSRPARHRQSPASLRMLAGNETQLRTGHDLFADCDFGRAVVRLQKPEALRNGRRAAVHGHWGDVGPVGLSKRAAEPGESDCRADDFGHRCRLQRVHRARISGAKGTLPNVAGNGDRGNRRFAHHADRLRQPAIGHAPRAAEFGASAHAGGNILHHHVGHRIAGVFGANHA